MSGERREETTPTMKVLLGTDGSETAAATVRFIAGFPFPAGTEIRIVSVIWDVLLEHEIAALSTEQWGVFQETENGTRGEVEELLAAESATLQQAGWTVTTEIRSGHPAAEIVAAAEDYDADLIVVGSHGLTGFKRFLLGSVSNQVLQSAQHSVLIVRKAEEECDGKDPKPPAPEGHPWRVLVCYDGSEPSDKAVDFCTQLDLDEEAAIQALTILPMVRLFRQDIRQELNWVWQQKKEVEKAELSAAADRLRQHGANVTTALVEAGDVSHAILDAGDEFDADLIVLGHKGKGAIERFLMGSVTPRVAHHACISVLAVR
jgi:nucleotide-binding universal stress UspA family protein